MSVSVSVYAPFGDTLAIFFARGENKAKSSRMNQEIVQERTLLMLNFLWPHIMWTTANNSKDALALKCIMLKNQFYCTQCMRQYFSLYTWFFSGKHKNCARVSGCRRTWCGNNSINKFSTFFLSSFSCSSLDCCHHFYNTFQYINIVLRVYSDNDAMINLLIFVCWTNLFHAIYHGWLVSWQKILSKNMEKYAARLAVI